MGLREIQDSDSSGILYSLTPNPDPRFASKGKKYRANSTYSIETRTGGDQPIATVVVDGWTIQQGDEEIKPLDISVVSIQSLVGFAVTSQDKEEFVASQFWFGLNSNKGLLAAAKEAIAIAEFELDDAAAGIMINPVRHLVAIKDNVVFHLILNRYSTILVKGDTGTVSRYGYNVSSPEAEILAALKSFNTYLLGW